jgi:hypothetical protein
MRRASSRICAVFQMGSHRIAEACRSGRPSRAGALGTGILRFIPWRTQSKPGPATLAGRLRVLKIKGARREDAVPEARIGQLSRRTRPQRRSYPGRRTRGMAVAHASSFGTRMGNCVIRLWLFR